MIDNVVQFGNILYVFESFGELHFRPTFHAGAVQRSIVIVKRNTMPTVWLIQTLLTLLNPDFF